MKPLTNFHMNWFQEKNGEYHSEVIPCYMHNLIYDNHAPFSQLFDGLKEEPKVGSSLEILLSIYKGYGYESPIIEENGGGGGGGVGYDKKMTSFSIDPVLVLPNLNSCSNYHIIALRMEDIEVFIRRYIDIGFNIEIMMNDFCHHYKLQIDDTFPSIRHDIANYNPKLHQRRTPLQCKEEKNVDESKIPCIYDNIALRNQSLREINIEEKRGRKEPAKKKLKMTPRLKNEEEEEVKYHRLLPVSLLPLFLNMFPLFYQSINNTFIQCHNLRDCLLKNTPFSYYPDYLYQQIEVLNINCEYICHIHQQSYYRIHCREESEMEKIYMNEIDRLKKEHQKEIDIHSSSIKQMGKIIKSLSIKIDKKKESS